MEAPHLSHLVQKYESDGLIVLAVNAWDEPKTMLAQYAKKEGLRQRILLDGSSVQERYRAPGLPTVIWINRAGVIVDAEVGFGGPGPLDKKTKQLLDG